ncbi:MULTISPECIES: hypothetical protein [Streptomyces]|uniref:Uncharacterized protein n=2 Tax=Streptomyces TaxID=1883 RepID=A0ABV9J627_9ACTN
MICEAITNGQPRLDGLVIARDSLAALRIGRILTEALGSEEP